MSTDDNGKKTGIRRSMQDSQVYPRNLGIALVKAWQAGVQEKEEQPLVGEEFASAT